MSLRFVVIIIILIAIGALFFFFTRGERFELPSGEAIPLEEFEEGISGERTEKKVEEKNADVSESEISEGGTEQTNTMARSTRQIFVTDGVKHSIPLNEILSGGPPKDGIPSIDNPKFISISEAENFLNDDSVGLGIIYKGEARFYPYQILVWHEIVNDIVAGDPLLVTYCPLCATGVVFDRRINGEAVEFGVSGRLWQSNLLMYNRTDEESRESLWSQVLGEAVVGEFTGAKLAVVRADTVKFSDWKKKHVSTEVLSRDTGATRLYGTDPYEGYYTDSTVGFGAFFDDNRLHPKEFVLGIEVNGSFKAYHASSLPTGTTLDTFAEIKITIEKSDIEEIKMFIGENKEPLSYIGGFWFSWLAVHPNTELYQ